MNNTNTIDKLREDLQQSVSDIRKSAYEFAKTNDMEYHERMMQAQREIFEIFDKAYESCLSEFEQVATVNNKFGDPESFAERELGINDKVLQKLPIGSPLFTRKG